MPQVAPEAATSAADASSDNVDATASTVAAFPDSVQATASTAVVSPDSAQATASTGAASPDRVQATASTGAASPDSVQATASTGAASPDRVQATILSDNCSSAPADSVEAVGANPTATASQSGSPSSIPSSTTQVDAAAKLTSTDAESKYSAGMPPAPAPVCPVCTLNNTVLEV